MADLAPFDPADPFDAMADSVRRQVAEIGVGLRKTTIYRELTPQQQIECLMAGLVTGTIGVLFAHIKPEGRDALMEALEAYLPQARLNAEDLLDG